MKQFVLAACFAVLAAFPAHAADTTINDTARFLAGLETSAGSPLAPMTQDRDWQQHARRLNAAFSDFQTKQLPRIRNWSKEHLTAPQSTLFYMFSGPDFLYANAFFPDVTTYILSGLEPVGQVPDLSKMPRASISRALYDIDTSLRSILSVSFFITKKMKVDLRASRVEGTLPILYVFLARSGMSIKSTALVHLTADGEVQRSDSRPSNAARGVKIEFVDPQGKDHTLYYFSTNLADDSFPISGFEKFCAKFGPADSFIKSASYLLHKGGFTKVRKFLLDNSAAIVQDDTGIPVAYFDDKAWKLRPFGRYLYPLSIFPGTFQQKLQDIYARDNPAPIDFGVGYRWRPRESNLLLATSRAVPLRR